MDRRSFLASLTALGPLVRGGDGAHSLSAGPPQGETKPPINRRRLVENHNVVLTRTDPLGALTVGNGEFAFTADFTGLQTFPEFHDAGLPLGTLSNWGWHSFANPEKFKLEDTYHWFDAGGRRVPYPEETRGAGRESAAGEWLRANPHRVDLGRIGFILKGADGKAAGIESVHAVSQTLRLLSGAVESEFEFEGERVLVETVAHPRLDLVAVRVRSGLAAAGRLGIEIHFPYAAGEWGRSADWSHPELHQTEFRAAANGCRFSRRLDATEYFAACAWSPRGEIRRVARHRFQLFAEGTERLEFSIAFSPAPPGDAGLPPFRESRQAAEQKWENFWARGGAIELSGSKDRRSRELERRIVLSQYVTAVNSSGSLPPQETGLAATSWFGKFHLEMHWWHGAHFALWNRLELLKPSLEWYGKILPAAEATARLQGEEGARWPKMTGPAGRESPSGVGPFLVWQQPHQMYFAELVRRAWGAREAEFRERVFKTAEFLASYPQWNARRHCFELGPPIISAQEGCARQKATAKNPAFELAYFHWALKTAQQWRRRLGLNPEPRWDRVADHLAPLAVRGGVYAEIEMPVTAAGGHPTMLAALGFLPRTPLVDPEVMRRTLHQVFEHWDWASTWGWDYPLMAMTAARLGEPDKAVDALLMDTPKNRYLANGYNFQELPRLPIYLPGNGGLLAATAMMAAGWDEAPARHAPGFPDDGGWTVAWEGLNKAP